MRFSLACSTPSRSIAYATFLLLLNALFMPAAVITFTDVGSFLAAVGSEPIGQENFARYKAASGSFASYPRGLNTGPNMASFGFAGGSIGPIRVYNQSPVTGFGDGGVLSPDTINGGLGIGLPPGTRYFGFDIDVERAVANNPVTSISVNGTVFPMTRGFVGFVYDTPALNGLVVSINANTVANIYIDNLLYANAPSPVFPEHFDCSLLECLIEFGTILGYGAVLDPVAANAYTYSIVDGGLFTSVGGLPAGFGAPFHLSAGGTDYGILAPNTSFIFPIGVPQFTISGITPAVDGASPTAFPVTVGLSNASSRVVANAFFQDANVPEPSTGVFVLLGFMGIAGLYEMRRFAGHGSSPPRNVRNARSRLSYRQR